MKLSDAAMCLQVDQLDTDVEFQSICTDTRKLQPGDLFIAVKGERFDGHDFIERAVQAGAAAAIISRPIEVSIPCLQVEDTRMAYGELALAHRQQLDIKVIAVTGSCGKTTTRALLHSVFSQAGNTHASIGSYNNNIGVPYTLLQLKPEHDYLIAELGANHIGEISELTRWVKPDVAIITNVAAAHLEGFGSMEGIAEAKGEIYEGLPVHGCAIMNADDQFCQYWRDLILPSQRIITFGIANDADVMGRDITLDEEARPSFTLCYQNETVSVQLQLMGKHNVANALATAAAGIACGLSLSQIKVGLETAAAEKRRLNRKQTPEGAIILDDSYNANPLSTRAAIDVLASAPQKKILVLGDMGELGDAQNEMHEQIGAYAHQQGIETFLCYGPLMQYAANGYGEGARHFSDKEQLAMELKKCLGPDTLVLIKGSNYMGMDQIVKAVVEES